MEVSALNSMCRCCATEGVYKDIKTSYHWMGEEEIYGDMLQECFDVNLTSSEEGGICEVCITQLRNASNFKKQVLQTEEQFKKHLQSKGFKSTQVKEEISGFDENDSDDMDNVDDEDYVPDYEVPIKIESESEEKPPKKRPSKAPATRAKKSKSSDADANIKSKDDPSDPPKRMKRKKKSDVSATPERVEHRVNLTAILQYSNASPFKDKNMRGFSCLYCSKYFPTIHELRDHTAQQKEKDKLNSIIDYKLSYYPIKVDITHLQCNVCCIPMKDLSDLKDHLVDVHNKTIYRNIKDIILPFRLEDGFNFTCVVCTAVHITFKNLYHHMSSHYRNYCCNKCGEGYITIGALRKHGKTHAQGVFPCKYCEKTYTTAIKMRNHMKGVHIRGWLRNKCPDCSHTFSSYYDRNEHMAKVHNAQPMVYACNACSKTYRKKFELNRHIRHHHLQQKNYLCDKCNAKFYSKRGLTDHMQRHNNVTAEYTCDVCGKVFSRTRSLKDHLKLHMSDKKFYCEVCDKSFSQRSTLKNHLRLHQDNLDIFKEFDDVKHLIDNREMTLKQIAAESKKKSAQKAVDYL